MQRMSERYLRFVCGAFLAVYGVALVVSFATQRDGRTIFGPNLGADYLSFYTAGKIHGEVERGRIYDRALQQEISLQVLPAQDPGTELPYANAPFFILPFALLAQIGRAHV